MPDGIKVQPESEAAAPGRKSNKAGPIPDHLQDLYDTAVPEYHTDRHRQLLANMLWRYRFVFSTAERDLGCTTLVEHEIPLKAGSHPLQQSHPYRLGPETEAEVERQARDICDMGTIEPAGARGHRR